MLNSPDLKARSPWSRLNNVQAVRISPIQNNKINHDIRVPGSKSFTNRALIMAALARGTSTLTGILKSDDSYWCIDALHKLGITIETVDETVTVHGCNSKWPVKKGDLYIGAAGTIARFLPGALSTDKEGDWVIEASNRMSQRPLEPLIIALTDLGANIEYINKEGYLPIRIKAGGLRGGPVSISGKVSSQFISGLLLASPFAEREVTVAIPDTIVQKDYVRITLSLMEQFGVEAKFNDNLTQIVVPKSHYLGRDLELEADASTASYFLALAAITNGRIKINNLSVKTNQPDIKMVDVYEKMGCKVVRGEDYIELTGTPNLLGGFEISMKEMSDQTLTLASIAPFASAPITMKDVEHIRHHESDRISAICKELGKLGIKVEEYKDGLTVHPGNPQPESLDSHDDHRIAMSLTLIGTRIPGITINDPGCVSKTCPTYFELLSQLGVNIDYKK
ncbi:3-phosphoshikimate 1-carboxyvinyltransferase [Bacillus sp. Marseille-Q3570]|uniref:3-phosphoshikimate 1-carboxyvinyltransferase n=1 Tax=Bacillus sp. Marseille-Q3570 TaxID=2963522 RepID=UPI0021B71EAC|nr:3-phosphoshikimate 1-carboxyvinyltransferase [Bacillus sp. Marseille-Q3570]